MFSPDERMLKRSTAAILGVVLCVMSSVAHAAAPPDADEGAGGSTSPKGAAAQAADPGGVRALAVEAGSLTFSEFTVGTTITTQYQSRGLRFTSSTFITTDTAQPTSPVLSGQPRYEGPIEFSIVNPTSGASTTADGFSVDVGYIDSPNSVEILYYGIDNRVLGSQRANAFGINRVRVPARGVARVRISAVENEPAGFTIDNLLINLPVSGIRPTRIAALGDSYTSGEGLVPEGGLSYDCGTDLGRANYYEGTDAVYPFVNGTCATATGGPLPADYRTRPRATYENLCHRHGRAWPVQAAQSLGVSGNNLLFVACSGAVTENIGLLRDGNKAQYGTEPGDVYGSPFGVAGGNTQAVDLANFAAGGAPDLITIGVGGNDAGFKSILMHCLSEACAQDTAWKNSVLSTVYNTVYDKLVKTYSALRSKYGSAQILTYGYPSVFDTSVPSCVHYLFGVADLGPDEVTWFSNTLLPELNQTIADAAATAGITYMDITNVTRGHEICPASGEASDAWINGVRKGNDIAGVVGNESFHPNQSAHDAIFSYFRAHYMTADGRLTFSNPAPNPTIPQTRAPATVIVGRVNATPQGDCGSDCLQPSCNPGNCGVVLQGGGFSPNTVLQVTAHSDPVSLGTITTDARGNFDAVLAIPAQVPDGDHFIALSGTDTSGRRQVAETLVSIVRSSLPGLGYTALVPARLLDTRPGGQTIDGGGTRTDGARPAAGETVRVTVTGRGGVPVDATAVVLNVTSTDIESNGYLTVYPCGQPQPNASNVNYSTDNPTIAGLVVARPGDADEVCVFTSTSAHVIADVNGYMSAGSGYRPLDNPSRLLDTRGGSTIDGIGSVPGRLPAGSVTELQVTGRGGVPGDAVAAVLNVTLIDGAGGYVTVYPCGAPVPDASNLNASRNPPIANSVIARIGEQGRVCLFNYSSADLLVDVSGWYAPGSEIQALPNPARIRDSRGGQTIDGQAADNTPVNPWIESAVNVAGRAGVPADATVAVLNVTIVGVGSLDGGYVTIYPCGAGVPNASNVNYVYGQWIPNAVIAKLGAGGAICALASTAINILVDVSGWA